MTNRVIQSFFLVDKKGNYIDEITLKDESNNEFSCQLIKSIKIKNTVYGLFLIENLNEYIIFKQTKDGLEIMNLDNNEKNELINNFWSLL